MPLTIHRAPDGTRRCHLEGEPAWCHVLLPGDALPDAAGETTWLLLAFAVWSAPDREAVDMALGAARAAAGAWQLVLCPYDDLDDLASLQGRYAALDPELPGPHWLLLRGGRVQALRRGDLASAELAAWIAAA